MPKKPDKNAEKTEHYCGTNLPEDVYEDLKMQAKVYGRSISKEIMVLVRDGIAARNKAEFEFTKPKKK